MYKIIKPPLQELSGEELLGAMANRDSGARLDVVADVFGYEQREKLQGFQSIRNLKPTILALINLQIPWEREEEALLTAYPWCGTQFVFPTSNGGMAKEASIFYKRMASLLSEKHGQTYSTTMAWLRCVLSFSLLRSSILCFRGHLSAVGRPSKTTPLLPVGCP